MGRDLFPIFVHTSSSNVTNAFTTFHMLGMRNNGRCYLQLGVSGQQCYLHPGWPVWLFTPGCTRAHIRYLRLSNMWVTLWKGMIFDLWSFPKPNQVVLLPKPLPKWDWKPKIKKTENNKSTKSKIHTTSPVFLEQKGLKTKWMRGSGTTDETQPAKPQSSADSGRLADTYTVPFIALLPPRVRVGLAHWQTVTMAGNISHLAK